MHVRHSRGLYFKANLSCAKVYKYCLTYFRNGDIDYIVLKVKGLVCRLFKVKNMNTATGLEVTAGGRVSSHFVYVLLGFTATAGNLASSSTFGDIKHLTVIVIIVKFHLAQAAVAIMKVVVITLWQ